MGTSFFCFPRILRRPQTETVANLTWQSNVAARHNIPESSPEANPEQSYHLDTITSDAAQQSGTIQHVVRREVDLNAYVTGPQIRREQPTPETSTPQRQPPSPLSLSSQHPPMLLSQPLPLPSSRHSLESASVDTEAIRLPLPGFFDEHGILRKQQVPGDGRCAEGVIATILNEFGIPEMTTEEFKREMADEEATVANLMKLAQRKGLTEELKRELAGEEATVSKLKKLAQRKGLTEEFKQELADGEATVTKLKKLARKKGLKAERYDVENFVENRISNIENVKAFMIFLPTNFDFFHGMAIIHPDNKERFLPTKYFHESDSYDQNKSKTKKYSGDTAQDALLDYETQNNVIASAVLTFREIVSADGPEWMFSKGCALFDRSLWKEAIEAYDEVITGLREAKEPKQREFFAAALHTKGLAHYKLKEYSKAIEAFNEVIKMEADPALRGIAGLREIVKKARHDKAVARRKLLTHGDSEQAGASRT